MRLAHISWKQAEEYFKNNDTILIATGSIESHGTHVALGTDTLIPDKILDIIEDDIDVMIAPTVPYGAWVYQENSADLIKKYAGIKKGSGVPHTDKVGHLTAEQLREIAKTKEPDLNSNDIDNAARIIAGTARSMGVTTDQI